VAIDSATAIQYTGYFQGNIRKTLEQGKVTNVNEEARVQRILEEQRKRIQPAYESMGKLVDIII